MKIRLFFSLFLFVFTVISPTANAVIAPIDSTAQLLTHKKSIKKKIFLFKKPDERKSINYGKIGKILGFVFLGLMLLVPIVYFQARLTLIIAGLIAGILAIIFGLIGMSKAKDESSSKKARKSFWIILGIIAGILLLSILVGLIVLLSVGFA